MCGNPNTEQDIGPKIVPCALETVFLQKIKEKIGPMLSLMSYSVFRVTTLYQTGSHQHRPTFFLLPAWSDVWIGQVFGVGCPLFETPFPTLDLHPPSSVQCLV